MKMILGLMLFLMVGSGPLQALDVHAYPAIDLVQLPSDDLIFVSMKEDARGPYYLTVVRRPDGIFEKGMLRFKCRVDQDGIEVCVIRPKAYTFIAWYMKCDPSGECEEEISPQERRRKMETAAVKI